MLGYGMAAAQYATAMLRKPSRPRSPTKAKPSGAALHSRDNVSAGIQSPCMPVGCLYGGEQQTYREQN